MLVRSGSTASITRRLLAGTGWAIGWRLISRSLGFISMLVLAGLLVPEDFGIVAVATSVSGAVEGLSQLGVRDALVRMHDEQLEYFNTAFTLQIARGALTALLLIVISCFSTDLFNEPRLQFVFLAMAGLAFVSGFENIGIVRLARDLDFRTQFLMQIAPRILGFSVTITFAFSLHNYNALIWGMSVSRLTGVLMTYMASTYRPKFGLVGWRYLLSFSFWTWASSLAAIVWNRSDPFLLGPTLGSTLLGIFLLASEIALMPISELLEPVCSTLFPGFAFAQRGGAKPIDAGLTIAGALALCVIPFSVGISACSGYLVAGLLGPKWQDAQPVIAILAWACIFSPFSFVSSSLLSAQGQIWRVFISNALAAFIRVAVILLVRETRDLNVIASASAVVVGLESLLFISQLNAAGNSEMRQVSLTLARAALAAILTSSVLYLLPGTWEHVTQSRIAALLAGAAIGVLTFALFAICQALLWISAGRPPGIEKELTATIRLMLPSIRA